MAVAETVVLPAQPAAGFTKAKPLGGNGYQSPFAQQVVQVQLASDGTGDQNTITLELDPVYLNLVSLVQVSVGGAAADIATRLQIIGPQAEFLTFNGLIPFHDPTGGTLDNNLLWSPPPLLLSEVQVSGDATISAIIPNVNTETFFLSAWIYQFNKRAEEFTPINQLLSVLARGTTIT